ncbi:TetR/AcrR family transcriptional regulator [Microlunatus parietis]|uniref:AcrR family transcriptional regulator n=1 Tax=Microlunatus parietis TaxID=682979 RepID=A0A7Y9LC20_9ACTN|nr:TetR/AcrR family transcriptional regulator [Microlunatus parietis]NYE71250.1 AcrR family transcriptional regulator [Microlunatus parietis]
MAPQPGKDSPAVQARRRRQQDRIVRAAATLFARQGIHRTSMQQIAAEAGMSVGSLYQYLPNKEAIIAEATLANDRATAQVLGEHPDFQQLRDLLGETLRRTAAAAVEHVVLSVEISAEASRNPAVAERLAEQFETACGLLGDAFRRLDPELGEPEARTRAELYIVAQAGFSTLRASRVRATGLAEAGDRILDLVLPPTHTEEKP